MLARCSLPFSPRVSSHAPDAAVGHEPQAGDEHIQAAGNPRTHERERNGERKLSLLLFASGETSTNSRYFFLDAADLSAAACFFFWSALLTLACFCEDFFWLDFGDLSPITFIFFLRLTHLRHDSFSAGKAIVLAGVVIVNDGHEFIWRARQCFTGLMDG